MNHIKLIKSEQDHEQALARLMALMDLEPEVGSEDGDELDVLALLIEKYEQENFPIDPPDPIEAIKFRMDQQGLIQKDLIPFIGSAPKVTEVLNGKRNLSINMIRKLHEGLGISADVLIKEVNQKEAINTDIQWLSFPLGEMKKNNYFPDFEGSLIELKEYAAEQINSFLSSISNGFELEPALLRSSAHLRSNNKEIDTYALWAWQVKVLQEARENKLEKSYVKGTVDADWMKQLANLSWSSQGPKLAREYLNSHGIHLVIEPHLPKTYLDGALCTSCDGNPIVALTLRHDKLDNFWFSLMHELAHLALHVDETETWFLDDLDSHGANEKEQEADALAKESFIPLSAWNPVNYNDHISIKALANKLNIAPCIIAGRVRYELDDHRLFGKLFREKIRNHFK